MSGEEEEPPIFALFHEDGVELFHGLEGGEAADVADEEGSDHAADEAADVEEGGGSDHEEGGAAGGGDSHPDDAGEGVVDVGDGVNSDGSDHSSDFETEEEEPDK
jgi:hypothetical protein